MIDERERDIQIVCSAILEMSIESTGDYGSGGQCHFCLKNCSWNAGTLNDIEHDLDCIVLIARDLKTNSK